MTAADIVGFLYKVSGCEEVAVNLLLRPRYFLLSSMVFAVVGCANPNDQDKQADPVQVKQQIDDTVEFSLSVETEEEWVSSASHPSALFAEAREAKSEHKNQILCDSLLELSLKEIVVFEGEINNEENQEVLSGCLPQLKDMIQDFYTEESEAMQADGMAVFARSSRHLISSGGEGLKSDLTIQGPKKKLKYSVQTRDLSQGYTASSGDVQDKQFVLTYDDGPHAIFTKMIMSALKTYGGKGIFFMTGKSTESNPEVARLVAKEGHAIGSHSYSHPFMGKRESCSGDDCRRIWVDTLKAMSEIRIAHQIIFDVVGFIDPFFRFPFGGKTPELREFLKKNQMADFAWRVDSNDWRSGQSPRQVMENTLRLMDEAKRGVVLFHDVHQRTAEMMPQFLSTMVDRGYEVVLLKASDDSLRTNPVLLRSDIKP